MAEKIKFIPCKLLLKILNDESVGYGFNQNLTDKIEEIPEASYPITQALLHSYPTADAVRCTIILNDKGNAVILDIPVARYNELPDVET